MLLTDDLASVRQPSNHIFDRLLTEPVLDLEDDDYPSLDRIARLVDRFVDPVRISSMNSLSDTSLC